MKRIVLSITEARDGKRNILQGKSRFPICGVFPIYSRSICFRFNFSGFPHVQFPYKSRAGVRKTATVQLGERASSVKTEPHFFFAYAIAWKKGRKKTPSSLPPPPPPLLPRAQYPKKNSAADARLFPAKRAPGTFNLIFELARKWIGGAATVLIRRRGFLVANSTRTGRTR